MFNGFRRFSVAGRVHALAIFSVVSLLAVAWGLLWMAHQTKLDDRRTAVRQTVEVAHAVLQWAHSQQASGQLDEAAAQKMALAAIVESVDQVAGLIHGIAHATQEQSQGVGSVHGSINHVDSMTQQNAVLVEESTAAASSLKDQAEALARVVARFKTSADHG